MEAQSVPRNVFAAGVLYAIKFDFVACAVLSIIFCVTAVHSCVVCLALLVAYVVLYLQQLTSQSLSENVF